jgi:16S rRNA (guanine527-N7)-methyltransferase
MTVPPGTISEKDIGTLLQQSLLRSTSMPAELCTKLRQYLQILLKWNARTNLTAIRDPEEIVRRHFGESLFAAQHLGECATLLDFGSGAGFPGLPIQLYHPELHVALAESQNKKAAFLREVVRTLGLTTEVWSGRVEAMPAPRRFDVVTLRAVDDMETALQAAGQRANRRIVLLTTVEHRHGVPAGFAFAAAIPSPDAVSRQLVLLDRVTDLAL